MKKIKKIVINYLVILSLFSPVFIQPMSSFADTIPNQMIERNSNSDSGFFGKVQKI